MKRRISAERARFLAKEIGLDFLASVLIAVSIKSFQAPNQIIGGGVAGIATLVNFLTGLPIGTVSFLINVPLLLVGYRKIGRRFILSTLRVLVILAVTMDYLLAWIPAYHGNLLLAALFGGAFAGFGYGLVLMRGSSTGGVDIIVRMIQRQRPHLSFGNVILMLDLVIVSAAVFVYRNVEVVLYAVVLIFVSTQVIDRIISGADLRKLVLVISKDCPQIAKRVISEISRGATLLRAEGAYSGADTRMMVCVVETQELFRLKCAVRSIDPSAFVIVAEAAEILGQGFKPIDHEP